MSHIARGPKKPVNMTLSEDLVREARTLTGNLSETVEQLLAEFIQAARSRNAEKEQRIDATIAMLNELYDKDGGLGEEFSLL
jgi:antitoxin CcdA